MNKRSRIQANMVLCYQAGMRRRRIGFDGKGKIMLDPKPALFLTIIKLTQDFEQDQRSKKRRRKNIVLIS